MVEPLKFGNGVISSHTLQVLYMITYPCWDLSYIMLVKEAPGDTRSQVISSHSIDQDILEYSPGHQATIGTDYE